VLDGDYSDVFECVFQLLLNFGKFCQPEWVMGFYVDSHGDGSDADLRNE